MDHDDANREAARALDFLLEADACIRRVKLRTTAITVHYIDVARLHCLATIADLKREAK